MAAGFFGLGGGGGGLPAEVTEVVNGATEKDPAAIRALWTELKRAYGDEATAVQAVLRQPQIINRDSYTDPPARHLAEQGGAGRAWARRSRSR